MLTYVPKNTTLRRQVPHDRRQGEAIGRPRAARARATSRSTPPAGAPVLELRSAGARGAGAHAGARTRSRSRALPLRFPEPRRPGLSPVLVTVPTSGITFLPSGRQEDLHVRLRRPGRSSRTSSGQVLEKCQPALSSSRARSSRWPAPKHGEVLFYREPVLGPGRLHDGDGRLRRARRQGHGPHRHLRRRRRRAGRAAPEQRRGRGRSGEGAGGRAVPSSPLYVGDQLLYPIMGEPFSKAAFKELPFYFVAYPAPGGGAARRRCRCSHRARSWPRRRSSSPPRTRRGASRRSAGSRSRRSTPGTYELRVSVKQGSAVRDPRAHVQAGAVMPGPARRRRPKERCRAGSPHRLVIACSARSGAVGAQQAGQASARRGPPGRLRGRHDRRPRRRRRPRRKGRPVTDLTAADFELREDGVAQALGSFTRVSRGGGIGVNVGLKEPGRRQRRRPAAVAGGRHAGRADDHADGDGARLRRAVGRRRQPVPAGRARVPADERRPVDTRVGVFTTEPTVSRCRSTPTTRRSCARRSAASCRPASSRRNSSARR